MHILNSHTSYIYVYSIDIVLPKFLMKISQIVTKMDFLYV